MTSDETANIGKRRCLVVEDDPTMAQLLRLSLKDELELDIRTLGQDGIEACRETHPDIILLDYDLPDVNGRSVCREIRTFSDAYIVMVTGHDSEVERVASLENGADDFIAKPFSPGELKARVQAMLRRPRTITAEEARANAEQQVMVGNLRLARDIGKAFVGETPVGLTTFEFKIVELLALRSPLPVTRSELMNTSWDGNGSANHAIDVHIHNIRRKLNHAGMNEARIQTIRAIGYRFAIG